MYRLSDYIDNWLREINYRFRSKCKLFGSDYVIITLTEKFVITLKKQDDAFKVSFIKNGNVLDKCFTDSEHAEDIWNCVQPSTSERREALEALDKFLEDYNNG